MVPNELLRKDVGGRPKGCGVFKGSNGRTSRENLMTKKTVSLSRGEVTVGSLSREGSAFDNAFRKE